jgi:hypothetical protein
MQFPLPRVFPTRNSNLRKRLLPFVRCPFPIFLDEELRPCAWSTCGPCPHRVLVCSTPKAGTYFIAEVLRHLGCESIQMHLDHTVVWDYRQRTVEEIRADSFRYMVEIPLELSSRLIRPGQFAVGHLECCDKTKQLLRRFKKVFIYRNLRDALISQMRFLKDTNSGGPLAESWKALPEGPQQMARFFAAQEHVTYMFNKFRAMAAWLHDKDVLPVSFEAIYGDHGKEAQLATIEAMRQYLDAPVPTQSPDTLMAALIGKPTRTWSGRRSSRDTYWNDDIERLFHANGGREIDASLGYDADSRPPSTGVRRPSAHHVSR